MASWSVGGMSHFPEHQRKHIAVWGFCRLCSGTVLSLSLSVGLAGHFWTTEMEQLFSHLKTKGWDWMFAKFTLIFLYLLNLLFMFQLVSFMILILITMFLYLHFDSSSDH